MAEQTTPRLGLDKYTSGSDPHPNRAKFNASRDMMEQLIAIAQQGTIAARPPAGRGGALYCVTDQNNRVYFDNGTQWVEIAPVGGVVPSSVAVNSTGSEGVSHRAARADHRHPFPFNQVAEASHKPVHVSNLADVINSITTPGLYYDDYVNGSTMVHTLLRVYTYQNHQNVDYSGITVVQERTRLDHSYGNLQSAVTSFRLKNASEPWSGWKDV